MVMHTEPYDYHLILHDINKTLAERKKDTWKDIEKRLEDYKKKYGQNQSYFSLFNKFILVKLDLEEKQGRKNDLVDELNEKVFKFKNNFVEQKMRII
jgi:hypothetical protein